MKMSVPGDAGYEVERFAEIKCDTCGKTFLSKQGLASHVNHIHTVPFTGERRDKCDRCSYKYPDDPACKPMPCKICGFSAKSSPVLGETVLTVEKFLKWAHEHPAQGFNCRGDRGIERYFEAQDFHTRKCLKEQGWKSKEQVEDLIKAKSFMVAQALRSLGGYRQGDNGLVVDKHKFDQLLKDLEG